MPRADRASADDQISIGQVAETTPEVTETAPTAPAGAESAAAVQATTAPAETPEEATVLAFATQALAASWPASVGVGVDLRVVALADGALLLIVSAPDGGVAHSAATALRTEAYTDSASAPYTFVYAGAGRTDATPELSSVYLRVQSRA